MTSNNDVFSMFHPTEVQISCTSYLYEYKHHVFPGLNLGNPEFDEESVIKNIQNYYRSPPLRIHKPLPCSLAESTGHSRKVKSDKVMQLIRNKYRWYRKKSQLLQLICRNKRKLNAKKFRLKKLSNLPYGFASLADHLSKNPDKYFKGVYNWYYGNVIATFKLDDDLYLLHAGGKNLGSLYISAVKEHKHYSFIPTIKPKLRASFSKNGPIYDVVTSNYNENVGIRQRDVCSYLVRSDNISDLMKTGMSVKKSKYPFVAMDISKDEFCTVDTNRVIKFWNSDTGRNSGTASIPDKDSFCDNFIRTKYVPNSNSQNYIAIDRMNVYLFDKRRNSKIPCSTWKIENHVEVCETLSLLVPSKTENYWYFGLTHSCLLFDIRVGFVQKWSHMLPQTPCVGGILNIDEDRDCLLLSTQSTDNVVAIYNNWLSDQTSASSFPVSVPNRVDTLHESRMKGVCSHPEISKKFDCSLIGLCGYQNRNRGGIFLLGSSGVVFHQSVETKSLDKFNEKQIHFNRGEISYLEKWEQEMLNTYANTGGHLTATDVVSMAEIADKLCVKLENPEWHFSELESDPVGQISRRNLQSYTDILSMSILNDFELDDDSEWRNDEENDFTFTGRRMGKVEEWLFQHSSSNETFNSVFDEIEKQKQSNIRCNEAEGNDDDESSVMSIETSASSE